MGLNRNETRALRVIERSLRRDDPVLAALLAPPPAERRIARLRVLAVLALGLALLTLGAVVTSAAIFLVGWSALLVAVPLWGASLPWSSDTPTGAR